LQYFFIGNKVRSDGLVVFFFFFSFIYVVTWGWDYTAEAMGIGIGKWEKKGKEGYSSIRKTTEGITSSLVEGMEMEMEG
jgi:hypothetical protein